MVSFLGRHFEVLVYSYFWLTASALAALAGRAWLSGVGLLTVLPFVVAYVVGARARNRAKLK